MTSRPQRGLRVLAAVVVGPLCVGILVGFVTAARNRYWDETTEQFVDSRGADIADGGSLDMYTSILADHGPFESVGGVTIYGDCMMVDTTQGMTEFTATMVGVDPRFRDPAGCPPGDPVRRARGSRRDAADPMPGDPAV